MVLPRFLKDKYITLFLIYILTLLFFAFFSYKIIFHDTWEYMALAKNFAGYLNRDVFIVHSLVYPFFLSFFVKYFPSVITLKLISTGWIFLIGLLLYKLGAKKTSFLIWVFSPIAWVMSIQIAPILPASFFLLAAYFSIRKWQENYKSPYFIISALSLGLSAAFYDLAVIYILIFILSFFYNRKLKEVIFYSLFVFLSFSLRLILDASLFSLTINNILIPFPFYSLTKFWGAILIIKLGLHSMIPASKFSFSNLSSLYFLFIISPLLFYLFKVKYKNNKNVIIFLVLSIILLFIQGSEYYYYLIISPIVIALLSETFGKKELLLHIIISSFIIFIFTYPYFIQDKQEIEERILIMDDLRLMNKDFSFDAVVFDVNTFALFYLWDKNLPYFISKEEYDKVSQDDKYYAHYTFEVKPKINVDSTLELQTGLKTRVKNNVNYETLPWLLEKGRTPPEGYNLTKCYKLLCVCQK